LIKTLAVLFVLCTAFAATLGFDAAFIPTTTRHAAARAPTLRRRTNAVTNAVSDDAATLSKTYSRDALAADDLRGQSDHNIESDLNIASDLVDSSVFQEERIIHEAVTFDAVSTVNTTALTNQVGYTPIDQKQDISCIWSGHELPFNCRVHGTTVAFLGDSTMHYLFNMAAYPEKHFFCWPDPTVQTHGHGARCDLGRYVGVNHQVIEKEKWIRPKPWQGPTHYGLVHPSCSDASGVGPELYGNFEFFGVEFANDVEVQTSSMKTTQDVVAAYLTEHIKDTCVVNAGIHDATLPGLTDSQYVQNVLRYVSLLRAGCRRIIWLSISAVRGHQRDYGRYTQRNTQLHDWNLAVKAQLPSDVVYIDVFGASSSGKWQHHDNVHMTEQYYRDLRDSIVGP